ncbi:acetate/propionate family kinase [Spirillospora sp. NPDC048911]|uniref:acetate/propionate family kinase n=1 Tax=Spirillospora sp. NPDC048911 TaxID=3364527 RepID=UPI0037112E51
MNVLVLNCGSSSIKYQLLDATGTLVTGLLERIGEETGTLTHGTSVHTDHYPDHKEGLRAVLDAFERHGPSLTDVVAVGHRVVHGGDRFSDPVLIDDSVEKAIDELTPLAPLHNPANLQGIRVARAAFPGLPHVAVFDTAFHQTLPPHAHTYAVPRSWADLGVRRYGFHGTSCAYVSRRAAGFLGTPLAETNTIVLHLGNGASATAVSGGRSVETSMGLTPLEGLVMGTRSGDIDPALPAYLARVAGLSLMEIDAALNQHSGMLALAGAGDLREVWRRADAGDAQATEALDIYCHRIRKYVGAYYAVLGRVDAIVFTAGVGENDARVRSQSLSGLDRLGITIDPARNETPSRAERAISPPGADVPVLVIPTNEEREIATQALAVTTHP